MTRWRSIRGKCNYTRFYADVIRTLPAKSTFIEVGNWYGRSLGFAISEAQRTHKRIRFIGIDHGLSKKRPQQSYMGALVDNLYDCKLLQRVTLIVADSAKAAHLFPDNSVSFCFIDANHSYAAVYRDITTWLSKLAPGGILAGHDYSHRFKGVVAAVKEHAYRLTNKQSWFSGYTSVWAVVKRHDGTLKPLRLCPNYLRKR